MLSILFYATAIVVLLYILGYGLTILILPESLQKYSFWLTPWIAIIFLIFSLVILSLAGLSVSVAGPIVIGILIILDLRVILKTSFRLTVNFKEILLVGIVMIMIFVFGAYPLLRYEKYLTTISLGNNDPSVYALTSDYLVNHSIKEYFRMKPILLKPGYEGVGILLFHAYRWGTPILLSFFLAVFHLAGYQLEYLMQVILFALCLPLVYVLMRILHKSSMITLAFALVIFGLNANLLYILYHNFFGQVLFWGIELFLLIGFYAYFFSSNEGNRDLSKYDIILGITITVLYFSYHEAIIFILTPLILLLILRYIMQREYKNLGRVLVKIVLVATLTSMASIIYAVIFDLSQVSYIDAPIGWALFRSKLSYANPFEMMGFYSIHAFEPLPLLVAVILSILVIGTIVLGIYRTQKRLITISFLSIYILFYIWTSTLHRNFFAYNRAVTYTLPLLLVLFSIGVDELLKKRKKMLFCIVIFLVGLEMFSAIKLVRRFVRERIVVDQSLIALEQLKNTPIHDEPIYTEQAITGLQNYWVETWTVYFLYPEFKIYTPENFDRSKKPIPDNSLILITHDNRYYKSAQVVLKNIIWENAYYTLARICVSDKCLLESKIPLYSIDFQQGKYQDSLLFSGWSVREDGHRWTNADSADLRLVPQKQVSKLHITTRTLKDPQVMTVVVNDKKIRTVNLSTMWREYLFDIGPHKNEVLHISLVFANKYNPMELGISLDNRDLSADIREIELQ